MNLSPKAAPSVLFVLPHLESGDFEKLRRERINRELALVRWTREQGGECQLCSLSFDSEPALECGGQETLRFPVSSTRRGRFSYVSPQLLHYVQEKHPDIVVFKGIGYRLARYLLTQSKTTFRLAFIAAGGIRDPLLPYADYVLAEAPAQLEYLRNYLPQDRLSILPKLNPPSSVFGICDKVFDVVNVGTFNPNKNQAALLPLADRYRLALVGDGECWDGVRSQAATAVCPVFMPGNLPREQVGGVIAQSRLMVHSAKYEGLPRVVMEAFAAGVPVVASRRAMPGAFEHGVQGLLVEPEDLLEAARSLLEDPPRLAAMGQAASAYAERCCSEQAVFTEVSRMYAKVMERPPLYTGSWWQKAHILVRSAHMGGLSRARELAVALGAKRVLTWLGMRK